MTLRRRLTLLVAMTIIVPITAVGVTVVNLIGNEVDQRSFDRLRQGAAFASAVLSEDRAEVERLTAALVADPRLTADADAGGDPLEATLRRVLSEGDLDVAIVGDANGQIVGAARRDPRFAEGVEVPDDAELVRSLGSGRAIAARAPLPSGGTVVAGRWLDNVRLGVMTRSEEVGLTLLSGREIVATTVELGEIRPGTDVFGEFEGTFAGQHRFAVAADANDADVTVLATARPPAGQSRTQLILILGGLLLVLAILTALVGSVVSGLVTGPVEKLMDAALAVSAGDLSQRVEPAGDIELSRLGHAFNQMTDNLRAHVEELEQSRHEFQAAMARLGDVLVSTHDIGGIIDVVLEACTLTLRADQALFFERVAMPAKIRATAAQSWLVPNLELNGTGIAGAAARTLTPVLYPGDEELAEGEPESPVAMAVPVVSEGRLFGVIAVYGRSAGGEFREEDVHTLQTLARQTEVAIGNVFLHDETRRQARTDGTTGLWNRREFELRARETVKEATRFEESFGVILVDIDDFKLVNDRFDHSTGDAALIHVASMLSQATREIDVVARWGGEEFIVLLPRAGVEETEVVAERVRTTIEDNDVLYGEHVIPLTVSIGYAVYPEDAGTSDSLFKASDAALLRAKRNGKNRAERAIPGEAA
ncbi:MAG TPA: diguanylate cyclase [Acidimicrobiales bacterium]|nr:diguanylate cyclase [Acidimicrobiales bacterium]